MPGICGLRGLRCRPNRGWYVSNGSQYNSVLALDRDTLRAGGVANPPLAVVPVSYPGYQARAVFFLRLGLRQAAPEPG